MAIQRAVLNFVAFIYFIGNMNQSYALSRFVGSGCFQIVGKAYVENKGAFKQVTYREPATFQYRFEGDEKALRLVVTSADGKTHFSEQLDWDSTEENVVHFLKTIKLPNDDWTYYFARVSLDKKTRALHILPNGNPDLVYQTAKATHCKK